MVILSTASFLRTMVKHDVRIARVSVVNSWSLDVITVMMNYFPLYINSF